MSNLELKIKLVTVVKNVESTIKRCLFSIMEQTYPHIEIVVIDGLSEDNTLTILEEFQHKGDIRIFSEEDHGIYDALNKGISQVT